MNRTGIHPLRSWSIPELALCFPWHPTKAMLTEATTPAEGTPAGKVGKGHPCGLIYFGCFSGNHGQHRNSALQWQVVFNGGKYQPCWILEASRCFSLLKKTTEKTLRSFHKLNATDSGPFSLRQKEHITCISKIQPNLVEIYENMAHQRFWVVGIHLKQTHTSSNLVEPLPMAGPKRKLIFQLQWFRCELLVSGRIPPKIDKSISLSPHCCQMVAPWKTNGWNQKMEVLGEEVPNLASIFRFQPLVFGGVLQSYWLITEEM